MYTYDIDTAAMFDDRTASIREVRHPARRDRRVRAAITDMWADAPGGWVYEWSRLASKYAERGEHHMASLIYGCAKFPCLTDPARVTALQRQLEQFELAAKDFPVAFERRIITVPYRGGDVEIPVHLYSADGEYAGRPVLIASGGVDTWKMDIHPWWVGFTQGAGVTTLAFDHPGTGETAIPLDEHADEVIRGIADYARTLGNGKVAHFGVSFGGNFAAMSGLSGIVDAAVDLGGPVVGAFGPRRAEAAVRHARHPGQRHALGSFPHARRTQRRPRAAESAASCLASNTIRRCWWSTGPTTTSSRSRTPWSSRAGRTPKFTCSRAPATAR